MQNTHAEHQSTFKTANAPRVSSGFVLHKFLRYCITTSVSILVIVLCLINYHSGLGNIHPLPCTITQEQVQNTRQESRRKVSILIVPRLQPFEAPLLNLKAYLSASQLVKRWNIRCRQRSRGLLRVLAWLRGLRESLSLPNQSIMLLCSKQDCWAGLCGCLWTPKVSSVQVRSPDMRDAISSRSWLIFNVIPENNVKIDPAARSMLSA